MTNEEIGIRFKNIRLSRKMGVIEFAKVVHSNKSTWNRIENGNKKTLAYQEITEYCECGNISLAEILGVDYNKSVPSETKTKTIVYQNKELKKDSFETVSFLCVIVATLVSSFFINTYTLGISIFLWIYYIVMVIYFTLFKNNTVSPSINYSFGQFPVLVNKLEKEDLKQRCKSYNLYTVYCTIIVFFVNVFFIGQYAVLLEANIQTYLVLLFLWTTSWELVMLFDFNASKFFTKTIFFEGAEKDFGFSKLNISISNSVLILFTYWFLELTVESDITYSKVALAFFLIISMFTNLYRRNIKNRVTSKYDLEFQKSNIPS